MSDGVTGCPPYSVFRTQADLHEVVVKAGPAAEVGQLLRRGDVDIVSVRAELFPPDRWSDRHARFHSPRYLCYQPALASVIKDPDIVTGGYSTLHGVLSTDLNSRTSLVP